MLVNDTIQEKKINERKTTQPNIILYQFYAYDHLVDEKHQLIFPTLNYARQLL